MSVVDPGQVKLAIEKEGQLPLLTTFDQVRTVLLRLFVFEHSILEHFFLFMYVGLCVLIIGQLLKYAMLTNNFLILLIESSFG